LVVEAGIRPVPPFLLQTVALDAASTTAPLNDVPNRAAVAREVRADRIRVSPGLTAYDARLVTRAAALDTGAVVGATAEADEVGVTASTRAPAATTPSAERVKYVVRDVRIGAPRGGLLTRPEPLLGL
jgi:hypothetical protein